MSYDSWQFNMDGDLIMAVLIDKTSMATAVEGDEIFLASYTRVKKKNGMWRRDFSAEGALVNEKISKEEIQSMGFALADDIITVDTLGLMGFVPTGIDYGDLMPGVDEGIEYGNLYAGSEVDIDYGDLTQYQ